MLRVEAHQAHPSFAWFAEDGQCGRSFTVNGTVIVRAAGGLSWLDVQGDIEFSDDMLSPKKHRPDLRPILFEHTDCDPYPQISARGHLLTWVTVERILAGKTVVAPNRNRTVTDQRPAVRSYRCDRADWHDSVTLTGVVRGVTVDTTDLGPLTCWVES